MEAEGVRRGMFPRSAESVGARALEDPEHLSKPITEVVKRTLVTDLKLRAYGDCTPQLSED